MAELCEFMGGLSLSRLALAHADSDQAKIDRLLTLVRQELDGIFGDGR